MPQKRHFSHAQLHIRFRQFYLPQYIVSTPIFNTWNNTRQYAATCLSPIRSPHYFIGLYVYITAGIEYIADI